MMRFDEPISYRIQVAGALGAGWGAWVQGDIQTTCSQQAVTEIVACVADHAALRGLVNRLWDLNLTVLSLQVTEYKGAVRPKGKKDED